VESLYAKIYITAYAVRVANAECLKPEFASVGHLDDASGNGINVFP